MPLHEHERMPKYPAVKHERRHPQQDAKTSLNQFSGARFDHGCVAKCGRESSILFLDLIGVTTAPRVKAPGERRQKYRSKDQSLQCFASRFDKQLILDEPFNGRPKVGLRIFGIELRKLPEC